ncbi:MAG: Phosphoheptose isomerase [Alphaproteobacteria bacterium MarineAlpha6_Bin6]|nr:sugar isomerase [Pelagibacteraceae bacterium]PPR31502.1 MAG: Phosphoheptose isomerase [Alphaproteobacteria bacterium MarineAlpha6_Bin6]PPR33434.1 MAG: Phosphoheptose isomerase [Alphaproteobacteria bacterium MarineAlpha6_Bin5]|tara:strand:+ start:426 stop:1028 length:603 start_codon:yes stop_codon:yes gene_type:complete
MDKFIKEYLSNTSNVLSLVNQKIIKDIIFALKKLKKKKGRVFFLGVGGGAGNATHAVNDFRKICGIESYTPSDNVSELTARINDDGWENSYKDWLIVSNLSKRDALFIFSVGGGNIKKKVSLNLVQAIKIAKQRKTLIIGITGPDGGYTKKVSNLCLTIPIKNKKKITAITESFQSIIWHLIVSHPELKKNSMKWESLLK